MLSQKIKPTGVLFHSRGHTTARLQIVESESISNPINASHCDRYQRQGVFSRKESSTEDEIEVPISAEVAAAMNAALVSAKRIYSLVYPCTCHRKSSREFASSSPAELAGAPAVGSGTCTRA